MLKPLSQQALEPIDLSRACFRAAGRPNFDPYSSIELLSANPDWPSRSRDVPKLYFSPADATTGQFEDPQVWEEVRNKIPLPSTDVFVVYYDKEGTLRSLTTVRNEWPLKDFRWMIGGRTRNPAPDDQRRIVWTPECDVAQTIYREIGLQPEVFRSFHPLGVGHHSYWRPLLDGSMSLIRFVSTLWIAVLKSDQAPKLCLSEKEFQPGLELWLTAEDLRPGNPTLAELDDYMRDCLAVIHGVQVPKLTPTERVSDAALITPSELNKSTCTI